jgi:hypothetical protein
MDMVKKYVDWVKDRVSERTSWDGAVICAVCLVVIFTGGLAKLKITTKQTAQITAPSQDVLSETLSFTQSTYFFTISIYFSHLFLGQVARFSLAFKGIKQLHTLHTLKLFRCSHLLQVSNLF